jgi:hypothetical protein
VSTARCRIEPCRVLAAQLSALAGEHGHHQLLVLLAAASDCDATVTRKRDSLVAGRVEQRLLVGATHNFECEGLPRSCCRLRD